MPFDDPSIRVEIPPRYAAEVDFVDRVTAKLQRRRDWCKWRMGTRRGALCLLGAVNAVTEERLAEAPSVRDIHRNLVAANAVTATLHDLTGGNAVRFNDSIFTTHKRVLRLLKAVRKSFE